MRRSIFSLAIVAMALAAGTGCATVRRTVVGGRPELTYAATARAALVPHLIAAEAAAEVATRDGAAGCVRLQQVTRSGTTSLQTGSWGCGGYGSTYGFGQTAAAPYTGYRPGEAEALAARGYGPGVVGPPLPPPAGATTDPALAGRVQSLEQSLQAVINAQAEALASQPPR